MIDMFLHFVLNRFSRPNHVYVPNPVNPAGPISQQCNNSASISSHQQNAHPYPSPVAHLPIPLASLVRAGVPVTQLGQSLPSALLNTLSTSANTTPTTSTSASKDDVVMIDLDELPSPTKPLQEPILTQGTQPNSDLMRLARNAFPNVSPSFIGLLLNQGNARGNSQENARANEEGTSSKDENKTAEATDSTVASGNKTSETGNTADNVQTLRGLLAPDPAGKRVNDESASPTSPTVQDESIVSSPKGEGDASPQRQVTDEKPSPTPPVVNDGTDDLASPEGVSTDIERPEARNTLLSEGDHSGEPEMPKSSSPTTSVEKKENTI